MVQYSMSYFGDYIRKRRLELGMTQERVAKRLQVTQNFVAYLEKGERKPPTRLLRCLSEILSLPLDKLYLAARPEVEEFIDFDAEKRKPTLRLPPALLALYGDKDLRDKHHITDADLDMLASIRARGDIRNKEDYIFLLLSLRQVMR